MSARVELKGMTWSHPRGYDPMVACAALFQKETGVAVSWDKRSLQDFESFPVEELARQYDLIVIDHPHVGQITDEKCLIALDVEGREADFAALAAGSVGQSFPSYHWRGRQWGFPIDAASQVQAVRADLATPAMNWADVIALAKEEALLPTLRPPHSLMTFFTLAANLGTPCGTEKGEMLISSGAGEGVYALLAELFGLVDPACLGMDPIAVFERMAEEGSRIACSPYIYGYVNYAIEGFRPHTLRFADIPAVGPRGHAGSALGGTGIAVSAFSANRAAAIDFAYWVASARVQKGAYAAAGGQPGIADAWDDATVNLATGDFYRNTRKTLEGAWVRPRHNGYMAFQQAASERINSGLRAKDKGADVVADLNRLFQQSFGSR